MNDAYRRSASARAGYTVVELMMSIAIFAIGVLGIASMQSLAARGNAHAKDMALATSLARSWQEKLAMDALRWGGTSNWQLDNTVWLSDVTVNNNTWVVPASAGNFGPTANALGEFVAPTSGEVVFCTHIRLTRLVQAPGSGLIRTEVRVLWPKFAWNRDGEPYASNQWRQEGDAATDYCLGTYLGIIPSHHEFYEIHKTSTVRETPAL